MMARYSCTTAVCQLTYVLLAGCAPLPQQPVAPPEPKIQTVQVKVEVPVPCFDEKDRPIPPEPTPIDLETATPKQLAFALHADQLADKLYMEAVERLFVQCQNALGKEIR